MNDPRRAASLVFGAMFAAQILFLLVARFVQSSVLPPESFSQTTLLVIGIGACPLLAAASWLIGARLVAAAQTRPDAIERSQTLLRASIIRIAILEFGAIIQVAFYLLTGEIAFVGLFFLTLFMFWIQRPKAEEWDRITASVSR